MDEETRKNIGYLCNVEMPAPPEGGSPAARDVVKATVRLQARLTYLTEVASKHGYGPGPEGTKKMRDDAEGSPEIRASLARAARNLSVWEKANEADFELLCDAVESGVLAMASVPEVVAGSLVNATYLGDELKPFVPWWWRLKRAVLGR